MKLEKRSEGEMQELVAAVAGPRQWGDTRQSWIARAARRANVSYRQAKALFYGEITDPEHKAARRMREAIRKQEDKAAKDEYQELRERIARLEARLAQTDADFHSPSIDILWKQTSGPRNGRGPVDSGE